VQYLDDNLARKKLRALIEAVATLDGGARRRRLTDLPEPD
jgi:hypothetical protein